MDVSVARVGQLIMKLVEFGSVLRLLGKGLPASSGGGTAGNLYLHVIVRVTPDSSFTDRESRDRN